MPVLWRHELANALLYGARKGRITEQQIETFFNELGRLVVILDLESWDQATGETRRLALAHGLTVYDAVYLELAMHRKLPLATFGTDLQKAAEAVDVSVVRP